MCNIVPDLTCVIMKVIVMGSQLGLLGHLGQGTVARRGTVARQPSRVCWLGISYLGVK